MSGQHDEGTRITQAGEPVHHAMRALVIQAGKRLVEQQDLRTWQQDAFEREALPHPARKALHEVVGAIDEVRPRPVLSARELEVLALLADGAPNKVIARRLDISVHTAKFHVASLLTKLGAVNRTDAIVIAMREGLVSM